MRNKLHFCSVKQKLGFIIVGFLYDALNSFSARTYTPYITIFSDLFIDILGSLGSYGQILVKIFSYTPHPQNRIK
jgi:hypothetical protein